MRFTSIILTPCPYGPITGTYEIHVKMGAARSSVRPMAGGGNGGAGSAGGAKATFKVDVAQIYEVRILYINLADIMY